MVYKPASPGSIACHTHIIVQPYCFFFCSSNKYFLILIYFDFDKEEVCCAQYSLANTRIIAHVFDMVDNNVQVKKSIIDIPQTFDCRSEFMIEFDSDAALVALPPPPVDLTGNVNMI